MKTLSVRLMLVLTLSVTSVLAGLPRVAATPAGVTLTEVTVQSPLFGLPGVLFRDAGLPTPQPAVVLLHGCSGMWKNQIPFEKDPVTQEPLLNAYLDKWGRQLAKLGYTALAVDSYYSRKPASGFTDAQWQNQCGWSYDQGVNENTVRPGDAELAQAWLAASVTFPVKADRIGLMGWSQGGTATMGAMGATYIDSNTLRPLPPSSFKAAVSFYPGCGFKYASNKWAFAGTSNSYWRPYAHMRIYHGTHDTLYDTQYNPATHAAPAYPNPLTSDPLRFPCETRVYRAKYIYGAGVGNGNSVVLNVMPNAHHSFDYPHPSGFPTAPCPTGAVHPADAEAECVFDLDALAFLNTVLVLGNPPSVAPPTPIAVEISIGPDSVNPRSKGQIAVAILTTETFDARNVSPTTVRFGPSGTDGGGEAAAVGTEATAVRFTLEDYDGDGDTDMLLHFKTQDTGMQCGDTAALLTGETFDGSKIKGLGTIKTVGCQ